MVEILWPTSATGLAEMMLMKRTIFAALAFATVSAALAGNVSATYATTLRKSVDFEWIYSAGKQTQSTVKYEATRTGGSDTRLSSKYLAYCTEIGEFINAGVNTHDVYDLAGGVTNSGGSTGPVTFNATRTGRVEKLYGSFLSQTTNADKSAAFQLALWELAFDNDATLLNKNTAGGKMWGVDRDSSTAGIQLDAVSTIAEGWLRDIRTGAATQTQQLLLLSSKGTQDLVTPVPEPATMAALGLGIAAVLRRRKK
jgi:hypothetical protein